MWEDNLINFVGSVWNHTHECFSVVGVILSIDFLHRVFTQERNKKWEEKLVQDRINDAILLHDLNKKYRQ